MADTGTTLGKAYVQIMPSAEGIKGNIEKVLGGEMPAAGKSAGNSLGQNLVSTLKKVIAAAGIGAAFKASISEGMDLEQNLGGTEAVFGEFADSIKATAADAYKNMGMSASEYMATANKMGSLFQGSGLEQQQALDLTTQAMQRAADVASVMGIDTSMAMESIAGAAKGNFTMMDNLGVAMNATTLEAYALEKGVNFKWNTASNAEKAQLAMQMFMDRTSQYENNFARESEETLAGSLGAMQSAFKNVLGNLAIGADVLPSLQSLADTTFAFLTGNLLPAVGNILSGLPNIVTTLAQGAVEHLPDLVAAVGDIVTSIGENFMASMPVLMEMGRQLLDSLTTGIENDLPDMISRLPQIIEGFLGFITENLPSILEQGVQILGSLTDGIVGAIPSLLAALPKIISAFAGFIASNLPQIIAAGVDILASLVDGIIRTVPMILRAAPQILNAFVSGVGSIMSGIADAGARIIEGLWDGIQRMGGWIREKVSGFFGGIVDSVKDMLGIHSPSTVFAGIGENMALGLGNGIREGVSDVSRAVDELMPDMKVKTGKLSFNVSPTPIGDALANGSVRAAGSVNNSRQVTIQSGAIVINAAPGQDVREIADAVMERISFVIEKKEKQFA